MVFSTAPFLVEVRALIALFGPQIAKLEVRWIQFAETNNWDRVQ